MKYTFDDLLKMLEAEDVFLDVDFASLDRDKPLKEQGVDSLDLASILFGMESYFNIHIKKDAVAAEWNTINKMLDKLNS